ncbi:hypothetical protein JW964_11165, partial [candidate division KSB1 bacterium]|nr:hypothetical protein [candidate division KSB1 bacterium]
MPQIIIIHRRDQSCHSRLFLAGIHILSDKWMPDNPLANKGVVQKPLFYHTGEQIPEITHNTLLFKLVIPCNIYL